jgi:hypothetical protein
MEPEVTQTSETQTPTVDLRSQMVKELEALSTENEGTEKEETEENVVAEKPESQETDTDETKEEDSEESDSKKDESDKKAGKPNRYQKLKAARDSYAALANKHAADRDKAVEIANRFRYKAQQLEAYVKSLIENQGEQPNPLEFENFSLKLSQNEQILARKVQEAQQKERQQQELEWKKQEMQQTIVAESQSLKQQAIQLANQYKQDPKTFGTEVLKAASMLMKAGEPDVSLADVAQRLIALKQSKKEANPFYQQKVLNDGAPKRLPGTRTNTLEKLKPTRENMIQFLDELEKQG